MSNPVEAFIQALSKKDGAGIHAAVTPDVRFRGLTPGDEWQAHTVDELTTILFGRWFEPPDEITSLVSWDVNDLAGRIGFIYRMRIHNADGNFVVEQQGYATLSDDNRIADIAIVCSGFRQE
ncbi:MAG: hypothetical protein ABI559_11375 [Chloroflexota bacterium]